MTREEEQLQAKCFQWFHNTYHEHRQMLHCNNNNSHNAIAGNKNKALGVVPGVSDLELTLQGYVLYIEMKTPIGSQSQEQIDFQKKVLALGHAYLIVRTFERFKELIISIYG